MYVRVWQLTDFGLIKVEILLKMFASNFKRNCKLNSCEMWLKSNFKRLHIFLTNSVAVQIYASHTACSIKMCPHG